MSGVLAYGPAWTAVLVVGCVGLAWFWTRREGRA